MAAGMRQRAPDKRLLEFLFETVAHIALATSQRLRQFAIERLLPAGVAGDAESFGVSRTSGGKSATSMRCPGAITVSQWQMFSSWRTLPGNENPPAL